jgi:chromosome partitioning protein
LATNLAVIRSAEGHKVLLIDADEQESASDWAQQRESLGIDTNWTTIKLSGRAMHSQIEKFGADYDDVIIDAGGRDTTSMRSALSVADLLVVPFKPRSLDVWTIGKVKTMLGEILTVNPSLVCYSFLNQADSTGTDNEDAIEILKECPELNCMPHFICNRKSFGNAATNGLGVIELRKQDKQANEEIRRVAHYIYSMPSCE